MRIAAWIGLGLLSVACSSSPTGGSTSEEADLNENNALGMTDVTILYPNPKSIEFFDDMLGPSSEDAQGELLPAALFQQLAPIKAPVMVGPDGKPVDPMKPLFAQWKDNFAYLRVVGVRLDPCFGQTTGLDSKDCLNTIRLVAQFYQPSTNPPLPDGRVAIHLFYQLTRSDFTNLARAMLDLRKTTGLPLQKSLFEGQSRGVHPTMFTEGLRGPYATALKALILKYAGEKTLTRIAFAVQDRGAPVGYYNPGSAVDSRWVFGGFDDSYGQLQPLSISTLDYAGLQTVDTSPFNGMRPSTVVAPPITLPDNIMAAFLTPNENGADAQAKVQAAQNASFRLQNPQSYTAKTADCVSCHMAKQALAEHPANDLDYKSYTFRLEHQSDRVAAFRHFGYDSNGQPVVTARVVDETANVLDFLNKNVLP
jgi:hypothetical protein